MRICVDDRRLEKPGYPDVLQVIKMDVPMHEESRPECAHEPEKTLESAVARVALVVNSLGGRVRDEHVEIAAIADLVHDERRQEAEELSLHLCVGVLIESRVVTERARNAGNQKSRVPDRLESDVCGSVRSFIRVSALTRDGAGAARFVVQRVFVQIVIPENEIDRFVERRDDEVEIFHREVSRRDDDIDILVAFLYIAAVDEWVNLVGNAQYLHRYRSLSLYLPTSAAASICSSLSLPISSIGLLSANSRAGRVKPELVMTIPRMIDCFFISS